MIEEWKKVPTAPGYSLSNQGRVRNDRTRRILKRILAERGFFKVNLINGTERVTVNIHRMVAKLFIPNPDSLPEVIHINGDKSDMRVSNLEWAGHHGHELSKPVLATFPSGSVVRYERRSDLCRALGTYSQRVRTAIAAGCTLRGVDLEPAIK